MKSKYETHVKPNIPRIRAMRRDGATEEIIYKTLGVGHTAFNDYKNKHTELANALKESKEILIASIEDSLFAQAKKGNMTAIIFSLKNLNGRKWRDKQEITGGSEADNKFIESLDKFTKALKE